jgi:hypothetical protein
MVAGMGDEREGDHVTMLFEQQLACRVYLEMDSTTSNVLALFYLVVKRSTREEG